MCKQLLSILFPLNILGKKRKCVKYSVYDLPVVGNEKTLNISWVGERLIVTHTIIQSFPFSREKETLQYKSDFHGDEQTTQSEVVIVRAGNYLETVNDMVYFSCTNVTSLIVNGQTLIYICLYLDPK